MGEVFDLFGDPVPANWSKRGRPQHIPSQKNRNRVSLLLAMGWSNARIAAALLVILPTQKKHFFSELRFRDVMRDRLDAGVERSDMRGPASPGGASNLQRPAPSDRCPNNAQFFVNSQTFFLRSRRDD